MAVLTLKVNDDGSISTSVDGVKDNSCTAFADLLEKLLDAKAKKRTKAPGPRQVHQVTHVGR